MGLDMYLYKTNKKFNTQKELEDFYKKNHGEPDDLEEVGYWRKHPDLHGIMETMFKERTYHHKNDTFNCLPLLLSKDDLTDLVERSEKFYLNQEKTDPVVGFFFGATMHDDWLDSVNIFKKALEDTDFETESIIYDSWW